VNDRAKKLVPHFSRTSLRKYLRTAWTGAVATVIAAGVLVTAAASVPGAQSSGGNGELPIRLYGLLQNVSVGQTGEAPDGVTLSQIVEVLERAEKRAQEEGPNLNPAVAQAAAELGMLYTTYQMQQLAFGENNEGLRLEDAPVARGAEQDADAPASGSEKKAAPGKKAGGDRQGDGDEPGDDEKDSDEPRPDDDTPPAIQVSNARTSVIDPDAEDPYADDPHARDPKSGYVTYDEVVIAAVRLANMLDPSSPNALVEVEGAEQRGSFSLRESLLDVVHLFGGSTTGYANGRIPADVLCPLDFAPGHMLRCDAAERLMALNERFEDTFGYAIPMTDSYRSYELQVAVASAKPHLAAIPGTSNHGWGLAVDLGNPIAGGNSEEYVWLRLNGPDYGWENPSWAQIGGEKPEPWHFEFFAAGSIPNRAMDPSDVGTWTPGDKSSESPRYKPALDPKPRDDSPRGGSDKPGSKPGDNPPSQKPSTPDDKPSKPADPTTKPTPTDPKPTPTPTDPKPTPKPTNPATSPSPSPSPSFPSQPPGDDDGDDGSGDNDPGDNDPGDGDECTPDQPESESGQTKRDEDVDRAGEQLEDGETGTGDTGTGEPCDSDDTDPGDGDDEKNASTASSTPLGTSREQLDLGDDDSED